MTLNPTLPRRQIAVDQPQGGQRYPFVEPSDQLDCVIGDLHLTYRDDDNQYVRPFSFQWVYGLGTTPAVSPIGTPPHAVDVLIEDAEGRTVFDSRTMTFTSREWGTRLVLYEWLGSDNILRMVQYASAGKDDAAVNLPVYLEPTDSRLDERSIFQLPLQLRSLRVGLDQLRGTNVILQGGYNTALSRIVPSRVDGGRYATIVQLEFMPGFGDGRYDAGSLPPVGIRTINGRKPNTRGNYLWDATDCYRVERPIQAVLQENPRVVQIRDHAIQNFSDCGPCCECDDFINVYEAIRRLRDKYADLIQRAQAARDLYKSNRARFVTQRECRIADSLRLKVAPVCPNRLDVIVGFCNNTGECIRDMVLTLAFEYEENGQSLISTCENDPGETGVEMDCNTTFRSGNSTPPSKTERAYRTPGHMEPYTIGGVWPNYWAHFDAVNPGNLAAISTRFFFPEATTADNLFVTADAYQVPGGIPATEPGESPIPNVSLRNGPLTPEGAALRLTQGVRYTETGIITNSDFDGCCQTGDETNSDTYTN